MSRAKSAPQSATTPVQTTATKPKAKSKYCEDDVFVLQIRPYRETSLLADILTRHHGRISVVAKGAKRLGSTLRQTLLLFQPLQCRWLGQGPLKTLTQAEWQGGIPYLRGQSLLCGYYANELLIQLCAQEDDVEAIFVAYQTLMYQLTHIDDDNIAQASVLRHFEWQLLNALGYAPDISQWCQQFAIRHDRWYTLSAHHDALIEATTNMRLTGMFRGEMLFSLQENTLQTSYLPQYKIFFQQILVRYAGLKPLNTRQVFSELLEL